MEFRSEPEPISNELDGGLPPGDHPLEVGARAGFGPLSPLAKMVWHGDSKPCVSCGQLAFRKSGECEWCGQDLSEVMLARMRQHSGPWHVFEHVRPFPGISFQLLVRQIRRGLVTATSIVRGPATDHQWRFAAETPGLCLHFGCCWNCHAQVVSSDSFCRSCLTVVTYREPSSLAASTGFGSGGPTSFAPTGQAHAGGHDGALASPAAAMSGSKSESAASKDANSLRAKSPSGLAASEVSGTNIGAAALASSMQSPNANPPSALAEPKAAIGFSPQGQSAALGRSPTPPLQSTRLVAAQESGELAALAAALRMVQAHPDAQESDVADRGVALRPGWIVGGLLLVSILILLFLTSLRGRSMPSVKPAAPPSAAAVRPS